MIIKQIIIIIFLLKNDEKWPKKIRKKSQKIMKKFGKISEPIVLNRFFLAKVGLQSLNPRPRGPLTPPPRDPSGFKERLKCAQKP